MEDKGFWFLAITWQDGINEDLVANFKNLRDAVTVLNKHIGYVTVELNFVKFEDPAKL